MEPKIAQFINKGMQQDYSISKASNEFAFKNHNIRITTRGDNSLLTVTNEKSNKQLPIYKHGDYVSVRWNKKKGYVKMSFGTSRMLSKITMDCEGTWLESDNRVPFKETFEMVFDGDEYNEFSFEYYIDGYIEKEIKITNISDIKLWTDINLPYEEVSEPKKFPGVALHFYIIGSLKGVVVGHCVTSDNIILYSTDNEYDYIYLYTINNTLQLLYKGKLGFSVEYPIETLFNYESENVQKVYWVDGKNRPRVINIKGRIQENNDSQFDFNPVATTPEVIIKKSYNGAGLFPSGTIQYVITYYNNFMQESAPVYVSPLQYLSDVDKGASTEDNVSCSFSIEVSNLDPNWDNIRVYSIRRSSLDGTALGYLVAEEPLVVEDEDSIITIIDNGTNQEAIDATNFLFNNDDFIPSTLARKADRLFFGDITTLNLSSLAESTETSIRNACTLTWQNKSKNLASPEYNSLYYYESQLQQSENNIKGFKYGETYRFALQFQNNRGIWGEPIYLKDFKNTNYPNYNTVPSIKAELNLSNLSSFIESENITNVRLLRAEIDDNNRTIVAQGVLSPTVYNMAERVNNTCFNINSWTQRFTGFDANLRNVNWKNGNPNLYYNREIPFDTIDTTYTRQYDLRETNTQKDLNDEASNTPVKAKVISFNGIIKYQYTGKGASIYLSPSSYLSIELLNKNDLLINTITYDNYHTGIISNIDGRAKNKDKYIKKLNAAYTEFNLKLQTYKVSKENIDEVLNLIKSKYPSVKSIDNFEEGDYLLIDASLPVTQEDLLTAFLNKEETGSDELINNLKNSINVSLSSVSSSSIKSTVNDSALRNQYFTDAVTVSMFSPDINKVYSEDLKFRVIGYAELQNNISSFDISVDTTKQKGAMSEFGFNDFNTKNYLYSHYLWYSPNIRESESEFTYGFPWIGLWQQSGSLSNHPEEDILKRKVIGNLWYCEPTKYQYNNNKISWVGNGISTLKSFVDSPIDLFGKIYKGNYNYTLLPHEEDGFTYYYSAKSNSSTFEEIEESIPETRTPYSYNGCNIKFNSSEHVVFKLNKDEDNKMLCLPGYNTEETGYTNIIYSTGEVLQTVNSIKEDREKCYIYPFIYVNSGSYDASTRPSYNIELDLSGGQFDSGRTVPVINGTYVIVAFCWKDDVEQYIIGDQQISEEEGALIEAFYNATKNNIIPYPKNAFNIKYSKLLDILSNTCKYAMYKVTDTTNTTLVCTREELIYRTADNFVDYYSNKYFIGVGGGIGGFDRVEMYSGGNCKISKLYPSASANSNFICCADERYSSSIYSDKIYESLPNGFEDYLKDNKCVIIGEFYRDLINQYGGTSPTALANTKYVVCSETYPITSDTVIIDNTYGDTYYQRWDCLRTYPTTEEDINSVVDIVSVMIESYTNLDGRYDSNRGRLDVHNSRPTNMNLINKAYSQTNNFFTIYDLDDRLKNSNFKNCYTWSLGKKNSELVDNWTKGLMVNVNPVDGAKGKITKLKLWKDYLLVFQEKGIARIHYNDQTTMSSLEGIPVEILNSSKVSGHNYLSETTGCPNKWSMATSEAGIYFVDNHNSIDLFNGNINSLSYTKSFKDWSLNNLNDTVWNPNNNGYYGSYDHLHHDYYITNVNNCLCYSEELQAFTSFYDYTKSPIMFNLENKFIGIESNNATTTLWSQFEGDDYCNFYGEQKDYSLEYNVNPEPLNDKVFTNLEYRAYVDNSSDTFDRLTVDNEYQHGETNINSISRFKYPNAEKKFRIWRLDIPRDSNSKHKLDRIRNPWIKLKLTKNTNTNNRMDFHDLIVKYFE